MCGPVPVAVALSFCLARGAHQAELLRYYTSGDIIGDRMAVVGYASVLLKRSRGERT
jgi:AmmeMemoRadiSam system protein B